MNAPESELRRLLGHTSVYAGSDLLNRAVGLLLIPVYTAWMTPADYGVVGIALALNTVLGIVMLQSMESCFTRFHFDAADEAAARRQRGSHWMLLMVVASVVAVLLDAAALAWAHRVTDIPYRGCLRWTLWTVWAMNVALILPRAVFLVQRRPLNFAALNLAQLSATVGFTLWFVVAAEQGVVGYLKGAFLGAMTVAVPMSAWIARHVDLRWDRAQAVAALRYALPLMPHLLFLWIIGMSDRLILAEYLAVENVGVYTLAWQIGAMVQMLAIAANNAILPYYYACARRSPRPGPQLADLVTLYLCLVVWAGVTVALVGGDLVPLVITNRAYWGAAQFAGALAVVFAARGFYFVFLNAVNYSKQVQLLPWVTFAGALVSIGLNLWLVPRIGIAAAVFAAAAAVAVQVSIMCWLAQRSYPLPYAWRDWAILLGLALGWLAAGGAMHWQDPAEAVIVKTLWAALFPLALLTCRIVSAERLRSLREIAA